MKIKALGLLGLVVSLGVSTAYAHPGEIVHCNKGIKAKKVRQVYDKTLQNGLYAEAYDTNGDGKPDVIAWSTVYGVEKLTKGKGKGGVKVLHAPFPTFYLVDIDFDGLVDKIYVDTHGEGNCSDIVLYEDLNKPGEHGGASHGTLVGE